MISKATLKQVLVSSQVDVENYQIVSRELPADNFPHRVFIGERKAGKSFGDANNIIRFTIILTKKEGVRIGLLVTVFYLCL